jgi:hypothetical protein
LLLFIGLLISSCQAKTLPEPPATEAPSAIASTPTLGTLTISGQFQLTNTSTPGLEVGVEMMAIVLEYRLSTSDPWESVETNCSFDPPAPLVLKEELVVRYICMYEEQLPSNAETRTTAEVKIYGNDEVFRLQVNSR